MWSQDGHSLRVVVTLAESLLTLSLEEGQECSSTNSNDYHNHRNNINRRNSLKNKPKTPWRQSSSSQWLPRTITKHYLLETMSKANKVITLLQATTILITTILRRCITVEVLLLVWCLWMDIILWCTLTMLPTQDLTNSYPWHHISTVGTDTLEWSIHQDHTSTWGRPTTAWIHLWDHHTGWLRLEWHLDPIQVCITQLTRLWPDTCRITVIQHTTTQDIITHTCLLAMSWITEVIIHTLSKSTVVGVEANLRMRAAIW